MYFQKFRNFRKSCARFSFTNEEWQLEECDNQGTILCKAPNNSSEIGLVVIVAFLYRDKMREKFFKI